MKTFAEKSGKTPYNWNEFLSKDTITEVEWLKAREFAFEWTSCPCANLDASIPRDTEIGSPIDSELRIYGGGFGFAGAIASKNREKAKYFLTQIDKRVIAMGMGPTLSKEEKEEEERKRVQRILHRFIEDNSTKENIWWNIGDLLNKTELTYHQVTAALRSPMYIRTTRESVHVWTTRNAYNKLTSEFNKFIDRITGI